MLKNTIHPGEFLQDILDDKEVPQSELARHIKS